MPRQRRTRKNRVNMATVMEGGRQNPYNKHRKTRNKNPQGSVNNYGNALRLLWNRHMAGHTPLAFNPPHRFVQDTSCQSNLPQQTAKVGSGGILRPDTLITVTKVALTTPNTTTQLQQPPSASTVVLHRNPYFNAEGKTRSGLLRRNKSIPAFDNLATNACNMPPLTYTVGQASDATKHEALCSNALSTPTDVISSDTALGGGSNKTKSENEETNSFESNNNITNKVIKVEVETESIADTEDVIAIQKDQELLPPPLAPRVEPHTCSDNSIQSSKAGASAPASSNTCVPTASTLTDILDTMDTYIKSLTDSKSVAE